MVDEPSPEQEQSEQSDQEAAVDPLTLFPPAMRKAVEGLAYLGKLTETVNYCGHSFGLQTLRPQHRLAIGVVLQPYRDTVMEVNAYKYLYVAMALTHVDGDHHFCDPIGPDIEAFARGRLNYIGNPDKGWSEPTIDFLWSKYTLLDAVAAKGCSELDFLAQKNQIPTSSIWQDALADPDSSTAEMSLGFPPYMPSS
jgi:hypothetical protein